MKLETISIEGFKCFRRIDLPLAPLTVLSGFNAAGKSTTLQSLLLIAQALRSAPHARHLALNGALTRLGTAGEVVSRGSRGPIAFGFAGEGRAAAWSFAAYSRTTDDGGYEEEAESLGERERLELLERSLDGSITPEPFARICAPEHEDHPLIDLLRNVVFLGATRGSPTNLQPAPDEPEPIHADVGYEGQFAAWWFVRTADNEVEPSRRHPDDERVTVRAQVEAWLADLFPGANANAETIAGTGYARLQLKMGRSGDWSRPANIGYGLSYAFPLIIALLTARAGQVVVVDSPEAHLHPRAQSRMGQMLARFAAAGVQVLIETHSDHVLSGIRLAVRGEVVEPNEVAIHFFSGATDQDTGVASPTVDRRGVLSAWPEGFFDQADLDLTELAQP